MTRQDEFPTQGDNFRTIGELALDLVKNAARKQVQLPPGQSTATQQKEHGDD